MKKSQTYYASGDDMANSNPDRITKQSFLSLMAANCNHRELWMEIADGRKFICPVSSHTYAWLEWDWNSDVVEAGYVTTDEEGLFIWEDSLRTRNLLFMSDVIKWMENISMEDFVEGLKLAAEDM